MADGSARTPNGVAQQEQKALPFFSINGSYVVAPGADADDLLNDVGCFAECAEAAIQAVIDGISDQGSQLSANPRDAVKLLFGAMYQVRMMANLAGAAIALRPDSEVPHG